MIKSTFPKKEIVSNKYQEKFINNKIIPRILEPLTQIHEVDQKYDFSSPKTTPI